MDSTLLAPSEIEAKAKAAGLSMAEVCRRASVAPSTFSRWKGGVTSPTLDVCDRLINAIQQAGDHTASAA